MDATRSRGRGRFFSCFRPFVVGNDDVDDGAVSDSSSCRSSPDDGGAKRKRRLRRSFSAALKAVIFRTALLKKSKSETRYDKDIDGSRHNYLPCRDKSFVKSNRKHASSKPPLVPDGIFWSNVNRSPYFSSDASSRTPSTLSSLSISSRSSPARSEYDNIQRCMSIDHFRQMNPMMKQKAIRKCGYSIPALELCVILVCLAALIWGKAFAIVACTSAWLFFAPGDGGRSRRLRRADSYEAGDSEEYKKRVIMEGLLERDRSRVFQY